MRSSGRMIAPACSALSGFSLPDPEERLAGFGGLWLKAGEAVKRLVSI